ncbi:MAG: DUF6427 family protein [Bacteroidales bacterium]|nr:DUF6427 family protein [Bacteroidales bacterium]
MIKFFSSSHTITLIFIPLVAVILFLLSFTQPAEINISGAMPFFEVSAKFINVFKIISMLTGIILIIAQALIINNIATNFEFLRNNYLTAFIYILLLCSNNEFMNFNPVIIANLFILLALNSTLLFFEKEESSDKNIFNSSFFISIASLFYFPSAFILPVTFMSLIILRSTNFREMFILLSGFLLPYCFMLTYYFWFDKLGYFFNSHFSGMLTSKIHFITDNYFIFVLIIAFIIILSWIKKITGVTEYIIKLRKFHSILIWFFLFLIVTFLFLDKKSMTHLTLIYIPVTIFISKYLIESKNKVFAEILLWMVVAGVVVFKFV